MIKIRPHLPLALLAVLTVLAGCSTPRTPAPIVDRGTVSRNSPDASRQNNQSINSQKNADQYGYHTVRKGDTLLQIANTAGQNFRDLVVWNNLASPNDIKIDQVLRVLPPELGAGTGASGPQASSVTVGSGIEVRPLGSAPGSVSGNAPGSVPATSAPATVPSKNGPNGEKKPYSEATFAELQKPDTAASSSVAAITGHPAPVPMPAQQDDNIAWMWPTEGKVTAGFDVGKKGLDILGKSGQQVLAASGGKVMYAGSGIRGYGNLVIVKHTSNLLSAYAHNKSILVKEGQTVTKGQKIAEMGDSDSDVVKLHFEIRQQGKPVDPAKFLPAR